MLVTWRYRKRKSLIQWFDPRAWLIFYACFLASTLFYWDARFLSFFLVVALIVLFASDVKWHEVRRAFLFIIGFVFFFSILTFLTGRGGVEVYKEEHLIRSLAAPFTIFGWRPTLMITVERSFWAVSQFVRVLSIAIMTILIPYSLNPALYGITFKGLGLPDKFAYAMDLTMRFIPTFGRDFQLTMDAQRARGYEIEKLRGGLAAQPEHLLGHAAKHPHVFAGQPGPIEDRSPAAQDAIRQGAAAELAVTQRPQSLRPGGLDGQNVLHGGWMPGGGPSGRPPVLRRGRPQ